MKLVAVFLLAAVAVTHSLPTREQEEIDLDVQTQDFDLEQDERGLETELEEGEVEEEDEVEERVVWLPWFSLDQAEVEERGVKAKQQCYDQKRCSITR